jgi:hypothetical protein
MFVHSLDCFASTFEEPNHLLFRKVSVIHNISIDCVLQVASLSRQLSLFFCLTVNGGHTL